MKIDLNSDLGESFGRYTLGCDEKVVPLVTSVNAACGFHAGDPVVMKKTVLLARQAGISVGAHPGFADLQGFGRRNMNLSYEELQACVLYQLGALDAFVKAEGLKLAHVKPHGAMYNMAAKDSKMAEAICSAVQAYDPDLIILAQESGQLYQTAKKMGLRAAAEVFADRAYEEDGTLVARSMPGSMITDPDEALARVLRMIKEGKVTAITGRDINVRADSVCVHGDGESALEFIRRIREQCEKENIILAPLSEIV
ncbi:MAG: 5-oxoprolinase subunit PxpA [Solobacterium sp.]|nr:5-oxoprolinase subunit PxpA [Solobacterium sp.]